MLPCRLCLVTLAMWAVAGHVGAQTRFTSTATAFTPLVGYSLNGDASGVSFGGVIEHDGFEIAGGYARASVRSGGRELPVSSFLIAARLALNVHRESDAGGALVIGPALQWTALARDLGGTRDATLLGVLLGGYGTLRTSERVTVSPAVDVFAGFDRRGGGEPPLLVVTASLGVAMGTPDVLLLILEPTAGFSTSGQRVVPGLSAGFSIPL